MSDYINKLPDDIFIDILSSLTVRDACRVRCLTSKRWKDLPDTRSILHFDAYTLLGRLSGTTRSNFVEAVRQFLKTWMAPPKTSLLRIQYALGNESASHIDGWILACNQVEQLDLDFDFGRHKLEKYVFPCHLLGTSPLKHLRLCFCDLMLVCDASPSWLNGLTTIELDSVSVSLSGIDCILSNSLNLESLYLSRCHFSGSIRLEHPSLKKLVLVENLRHLELSCPQLETFEFQGGSSFTFSNVPLLRKVSLKLEFEPQGCADVFGELARKAPQLQTLSLQLTTEVQPLPPNLTMSRLKCLDVEVSRGFDLFTILHMLYVFPILESLRLKVKPLERRPVQPSQYTDRPHAHLKEVEIGVLGQFSLFELAEYLLRNCVSLERIFIVVGPKVAPILKAKNKFIQWQAANPTVQMIVTSPPLIARKHNASPRLASD